MDSPPNDIRIKRLEQIIFGSHAIIALILDATFRFKKASAAFCRWAGYSEEELYELTIFDLVEKNDITVFRKIISEANSAKLNSSQLELNFISKSGLNNRGKLLLNFFYNEQNILEESIGFVEDIERRKEMEKVEEKRKTKSKNLLSIQAIVAKQMSLLNTIQSSLSTIASKAEPQIAKELRVLKKTIVDSEAWNRYFFAFEKLFPQFVDRIQQDYPALSDKEIKQLICLKAGLSTKESAQLTGLSMKSVEMYRYRLKKKFSLSKEKDLKEFVKSI